MRKSPHVALLDVHPARPALLRRRRKASDDPTLPTSHFPWEPIADGAQPWNGGGTPSWHPHSYPASRLKVLASHRSYDQYHDQRARVTQEDHQHARFQFVVVRLQCVAVNSSCSLRALVQSAGKKFVAHTAHQPAAHGASRPVSQGGR